jgi:hypothetical protein
MEPLYDLLTVIDDGMSVFKPLGSTESQLEDFQSVVKLIEYAREKGLLKDMKVHKESRTRHNWCDLVVIQGGLTIKGLEYLKSSTLLEETSNRASEDEGAKEDIIMLKPNFFGLGIDLNALGRWFKNKL